MDLTDMNPCPYRRLTKTWSLARAAFLLGWPFSAEAGQLQPPSQAGNILRMTNANVRLEYDLSTGRTDFYWQNARKITGFYSGAGLAVER